jgi:hypothetical protein
LYDDDLGCGGTAVVVGFLIGAGGAVLAVLAAAAAAALATGGILRGGPVAAMPCGGGFAFGLGEELGLCPLLKSRMNMNYCSTYTQI